MRPLRTLLDYVRSSLARKLVLAVAGVHAVLIALLMWQLVVTERANLEGQMVDRAQGVAGMLATSGASWVLSEDTAGLGELTTAASATKALRYAMFVDPSGRVLAHTDPARVGQYLARSTIRSDLSGNPSLRTVSHTDQAVDVAAPVVVDRRVVGWAWVSVSLADVGARQQALALGAAAFGAFALALGLFIAFFTARGVTRRLGDLALVSSRFREGERNIRIAVRGSDEVAGAAKGINAMLDTVADTERSLRAAQRVAQLGSWRYDPDEPLMRWSEAVYEIFGYDARGPALSFEQFFEMLPTAQQGIVADLLVGGDDHPMASFTLNVKRPDGTERTCWVEAHRDRKPGQSRWVLEGVCQDITEREAAAAQLRQAQKMEAVGQLTGGLAHDFNNLLAIVVGNLDLAQEELPEGNVIREAVDEALAAALRGSELTRQLLAFSRRQPLAPQSIDLNDLITGFEGLWRRTVGAEIEVRTNLADNLWPTTADRSQVESAILNLVINARDAMPDGGVLTVETQNARIKPGEDYEAYVGIEAGDYSVVAVCDNGHGMSPETVVRAFEPFFTTKAVGAGSGLGLSMVYGFAKQSGGHVKIYSEPGEGTAVRLYLPRSDAGEVAAEASAEDEASPTGANETILLVEDDDGVRRIAERQLRELGYQVETATNGPRALALLEVHEFDLLFTDIVMPDGMNGIQLADHALARWPELKILFTSGFTQSAALGPHRIEALLSKPYRKADLARKLRQVLDAPITRTEAA